MTDDAPKPPAAPKRPERGLMLGFAGLALAAFALSFAGQRAGGPPLEVTAIPDLPGFVRLAAAGATSSGGGGAQAVLGSIGGEAAPPPVPVDAICEALWATPGVPASGPADAATPIAVFSAANCPFCRQLDETLADLTADRPDLRVVRHEWPLFGGATILAARAVLAAARQDPAAAKALHSRLLRTRFQPTPGYLAAVAAESGLDPDRLLADIDDPALDAVLTTSAALAGRFGFRGTPSLVIGAAVAEGALSRAQIEALLAQEAARPNRACG